MPRAAVLGSPIAHSLSPRLHRAAYASLGLTDWTYGRIECDEVGLRALLSGLTEDWAGVSLTMPLKRLALSVAHTASPLATEVGAANTLLLADGRRHAENTDVLGMVDALREVGCTAPRTALVLGAGGTAAAALAALRQLGLTEVAVATRSPERALEVELAAERLGVTIAVFPLAAAAAAGWVDVVVSALPAGAADRLARSGMAHRGTTLLDAVYAPWPTALATSWQQVGASVVGGLDLLVHQAAHQVRLMTGRPVDVQVLRDALD